MVYPKEPLPPPPDPVLLEISEIKKFIRESKPFECIRATREAGRHFLLSNEGIMANGNIHFLYIREIGLGVVDICKAPPEIRENTFLT